MRRPRFSECELLTIVEEVEKRQAIITGKHDYSAGVTAEKKQLAWQQVCQAVSAVSRVQRTPEEVRKKFVDMKSALKSKAAQEVRHMEGTGKSNTFYYILMCYHSLPYNFSWLAGGRYGLLS